MAEYKHSEPGLKQKYWDKLTRYLEDGRIPTDYNGTENVMRPYVPGSQQATPKGGGLPAAPGSLP